MKKNGEIYFPGGKKTKLMSGRYVPLWYVLFLSVFLFACKDDKDMTSGVYDPGQPVTVTDVMPSTGGILTPVVIAGSNFGNDKSKVQVFFNDRSAVVLNITNNYIYALVPKCDGGETTVRVVVEEKNEGTLEDLKFDYVVSAKVTTVASDYMNDLKGEYLRAISVDDEENLVINMEDKLKLYSIQDNKLVTILDMGVDFINGMFSRDFQKYYALPYRPSSALVVILDKKSNWNREVIFATEDIVKLLDNSRAITEDDSGNLYVYGPSSESGGCLLKINVATREVKLWGVISIANGKYMAFNPKDKHIYMSIPDSRQIVRFDSRAESLGLSDWEPVVGVPGREYVDGSLSEAGFDKPCGLDFDDDNNLYVADENVSHTIRKVNLNTGMVTTIGGKDGKLGYVDGAIADSRFEYPVDVSVTRDGIVYVMEYYYSPRPDIIPSVFRLRCVAIQ